jgi:hypothetical protein
MSKPQTDLEELKELDAIAREAQEKIDARPAVAGLVEGAVELTPEQIKARGRRNIWIALSVGGFMLLVFLITLAKLGANVIERPL